MQRANSDGAAALLIEMNTPGGLVDFMRTMAGAILSSRVPVIVYVAPAGARAGSAGFFLLEAADVAAMAPGTNAGAAHVVFEMGGKPDDTLNQKAENDAEAFLRSYVEQAEPQYGCGDRGGGIVALVYRRRGADAASDRRDRDATKRNCWQRWMGARSTRMDGTKQTLHLANARIELVQPTMREDLLGWLVNPNIALLLLVGGALADLSRIQCAGNDCAGGAWEH